nr:hypothetical protein [Tanacetum cinerariifolium]
PNTPFTGGDGVVYHDGCRGDGDEGCHGVAAGGGDDGCGGVTAMATVGGDGSEMARCGGSGRSEWSSGLWRRLWVRRSLAGKGGQKIWGRRKNENVDYHSSGRLCSVSFLEYLKLYFFEYEYVVVKSTRHGLDTATIRKPASLGFRSCTSHSRYWSISKQAIRQMHNNIMAAGSRDRLPILAMGRYAQWRSRFLRYIDTGPNSDALRKCILEGPYTFSTVVVLTVPATKNSPAVPEHTTYFKMFYKPTNNNLRTSSNSRNKNVDTTPRYKNDNQSRQFGSQRTVNVVGARENVGSPVVHQTGIQCFNCKEFGYFAKVCRNPKRVIDFAYHKEKMLLYKQAEKGVPLQAEKSDWLADTDEEIDEQELEAHYSYMAKIQEVPTTD